MAKQIVMDTTGDTKYEFDPADAAALKRAERRFKELTGAGFVAAVRTSRDQSQLIRDFSPAAEETVFFPRLKAVELVDHDVLLASGLAVCGVAWCIVPVSAVERGCRRLSHAVSKEPFSPRSFIFRDQVSFPAMVFVLHAPLDDLGKCPSKSSWIKRQGIADGLHLLIRFLSCTTLMLGLLVHVESQRMFNR